MRKPYYILYIILLLLLLSACGNNPTTFPDTDSISFKLQLSRPTTVSHTAAAISADICTDYGITTINATVLNSSGATVTTVSWACSAHEGTITGVPAGANYTVRLNGIDSNSSIIWRGEKSGIDTISGATAVAGTITMTYIGSDTTAPAVTSVEPTMSLYYLAGVPVTTLLTATFSEKMALSSINISTFTVSNGSTSVSGSVTYDPDTLEATFIPSASLSYSTTYTATITTDVEDMAGNTMQSDYSWSFDTEAPPTAPSVPTGVSATSGNSQLTIAWDAIIGATSYNIYWSTTTGVTKTTGTQISEITSTSYTHTGLTNGTSYYYVVTAVNTYGESNESSQVLVIPQPFRHPKTGQTTCYDSSGNVVACAGTGQDGDLQKGVAWPTPRFTDNGDSTIIDNLTGLVWTKDGTAPGPAACSLGSTRTWQDALDYVACLNSNSYLGYTDWRLPNTNELRSLVHAGQVGTSTWLNVQGFNNVQSNLYWTSTTDASGPDVAWIVHMLSGDMDARSKSNPYYIVWPVRSGQSWTLGNSVISIPKTGQTTCYDSSGNVIACAGTGQDGDLQKGVAWPTPRFTDNGDSTIIDNLTGLVWTKDGTAPGPAACSPGSTKTWQGALDYVACLNSNSYLGYTDWWLPNTNELRSLLHAGQTDTAIWLNSQGFNNVQSYDYWSSTSYAYDPSLALRVSMWNGYMYGNYRSNFYYVWPVRSGQ